MKFSVEQNALESALARTRGTLAPKGPTPCMRHYYLFASPTGRLKVASTNMDQTTVTEIPATVEEAGGAMVTGEQLLRLVKRVDTFEILMELVDDKVVKLSAGTFSANLAALPATEFPDLPEIPGQMTSLDRVSFLQVLSRVSFSVCQDEAHRPLMSVYCNGKDMMASNMEVTTIADIGKDLGELLIPAPSLRDLVKLLKKSSADAVLVGSTNSTIIFRMGDDVYCTRATSTAFPDLSKILKEAKKSTTILQADRETLVDILERVSCTMDDKFQAVTFDIEGDELVVSTVDATGSSSKEAMEVFYGTKTKDADTVGVLPPVTYLFDYNLLHEVLAALTEDTVTFRISERTRDPVLFQEDGFTALMMRLAPIASVKSLDEE